MYDITSYGHGFLSLHATLYISICPPTHPPTPTPPPPHTHTHPHTSQEYIILCLDVGPSMDFAPLGEGDTHLEMALRVASQIVQQKVRDRQTGIVAETAFHFLCMKYEFLMTCLSDFNDQSILCRP